MKRREYFILPLVAGAFAISSCEKKAPDMSSADAPSEAPAPAESVNVTPPVTDKAVEVAKDAKEALENSAKNTEEKVAEAIKPLVPGSLEDLSKETGFAKFVPKGASAYIGFYDGADLVKSVVDSKFGKILEIMAEEEGESLEEIAEDPDFQQFAEIVGEEVFIAVGENGPEQTANLSRLNDLSTFHQMKFYVKMIEAQISGSDAASDPAYLMEDNYIFNLLKDEKAVEAFKKSEMPPLYVGFKVSDKERRTFLLEQIQSVADMILGDQDVEIFEAADSKLGNGFKGVTLKGENLAAEMKGEVEDMISGQLGAEVAKKYKDIIATKDFVMMAGSVDDYIVLFFAADKDQLKLAEKLEDSILANDDMAFAKNFADKDVVGLIYASEEMQKVNMDSGNTLESLAKGLKEGIQDSDSFGDTRVLEVLLDDLVKCGKSMLTMDSGKRLGLVAYLEDGFKVELYGGSDAPAQDFTAKRVLEPITKGEDILFSANWVSNPEYVEKALEYLDALGATAYQLAKQSSELDVEDVDFKEFNSKFQMFDQMFSEDLLTVWKSIRVDLTAGLGSESAIVVDINGELPTVPNIPKTILEHGSVPRISYISTVEDREKVGQSWDKINVAAESILKKVSEMSGTEIPMQRPFKNSIENLTSYTFAIPTTHQNCTPAAVVGDELFFLSSSPDFVGELAKNYNKSAAAAPGAEMTLDFEVLTELAKRWYTMVDEHGSEFLDESEMKEFASEVKPKAKEIFEALEQLDYLKVKTSKEKGELRSSLHFKVK